MEEVEVEEERTDHTRRTRGDMMAGQGVERDWR